MSDRRKQYLNKQTVWILRRRIWSLFSPWKSRLDCWRQPNSIALALTKFHRFTNSLAQQRMENGWKEWCKNFSIGGPWKTWKEVRKEVKSFLIGPTPIIDERDKKLKIGPTTPGEKTIDKKRQRRRDWKALTLGPPTKYWAHPHKDR